MSVVLPAHDEAGNVGRAVAAARAAAERHADVVEVIVVDDGSDDATATEAVAAGARVVTHPTNRGYGAAVRSGFAAAAQPWTLLLDADNQFDPEQVADFVAEAVSGAPLVVGRRLHRAEGATREASAALWRTVCRLALGPMPHDIDCAFKLVRTDLVATLDLRSDGATLSPELFARLRAAHVSWVEVPVKHLPRTVGSASGLRLAVIGRAVRELWLLRRALRATAATRAPLVAGDR